MSRKLAANVYVGETMYEAGTTPPKDIAEQITNPKAWGDSAAAEPDGEPAGGAGEPGPYDGMKAADLKAEIQKRNDARADESTHVVPAGKKNDDLIAALVADDEAAAAAAE